MKDTPRKKIEKLTIKNKDQGFYGTPNQFILLIESRLHEKTNKIFNKIFNGLLGNRIHYNKIYNMLLDGIPEKKIIQSFKF